MKAICWHYVPNTRWTRCLGHNFVSLVTTLFLQLTHPFCKLNETHLWFTTITNYLISSTTLSTNEVRRSPATTQQKTGVKSKHEDPKGHCVLGFSEKSLFCRLCCIFNYMFPAVMCGNSCGYTLHLGQLLDAKHSLANSVNAESYEASNNTDQLFGWLCLGSAKI